MCVTKLQRERVVLKRRDQNGRDQNGKDQDVTAWLKLFNMVAISQLVKSSAFYSGMARIVM